MWQLLSFGQPADMKSSVTSTTEPCDSVLRRSTGHGFLGIWFLTWNDAIRATGDPGSNLVELLPAPPQQRKTLRSMEIKCILCSISHTSGNMRSRSLAPSLVFMPLNPTAKDATQSSFFWTISRILILIWFFDQHAWRKCETTIVVILPNGDDSSS